MKTIHITANFTKINGRIKPMHAVNNMPTAPKDDSGWDEKYTDKTARTDLAQRRDRLY